MDAPRADGRGAFLALVVGAAVVAWLLFIVAATFAARLAALPGIFAGSEQLARDSSTLVVLAVILALSAGAAAWAGRGWLRRVRAGTGSATIGVLLGAVSGPHLETGRSIPPVRRTTLALLVLPAVGIALVAAGLVMWLASPDPRVTRAGLLAIILGAGAFLGASGLMPSFMRAIERRERAAAPADRFGRMTVVPAARHPLAGLAVTVGGMTLVLAGAMAVGPLRIQDVACRAPEGWSCGSVDVAAVPGQAVERPDLVSVGYAVHRAGSPAGGERRVLLIAVGGPGSSGIDEAEWYGGSLPYEILDRFDIVLFDARGVGSSDERECRAAFDAYARDETPSGAQTFARACVTEAGASGLDLRRYGTAAVVEDLEAIRTELGVERMAVYGASYGTVVAQAYAAAHPGRVSALVLDAPLDRRLSGTAVWQTAANGFGDVLAETLAACGQDGSCDEAVGDATVVWRRVTERMERDGGLVATLPDERGAPSSHEVATEDVLRAVRSSLYEPTGRMLFLRALAAAAEGDDRLLVRLTESSGDPTYWPGAFSYYATWCADVRVSPSSQADDTAAYLRALRDRRVDGPGAESVVRTLMPCLYWPAQPAQGAGPQDAAGVPTLILTSTTDPITPDSEARAIYSRIDGAHLVQVTGGGHVSFGSGDGCVDDPVVSLLVDGRQPDAIVTTCDGWVADDFVALTPYGSRPVDAPWSVAVELLNDPAYAFWSGDGQLVVPCLATGVARITRKDDGTDRVTFDGCSVAGTTAAVDGSGTLSWYGTRADLDVTIPGGRLTFRLDDGGPHATGTWNGRPYSYGD